MNLQKLVRTIMSGIIALHPHKTSSFAPLSGDVPDRPDVCSSGCGIDAGRRAVRPDVLLGHDSQRDKISISSETDHVHS